MYRDTDDNYITNGYGERIFNPDAYFNAVAEDRYGFNSYNNGYKDGYNDGFSDGYGTGYTDACDDFGFGDEY